MTMYIVYAMRNIKDRPIRANPLQANGIIPSKMKAVQSAHIFDKTAQFQQFESDLIYTIPC